MTDSRKWFQLSCATAVCATAFVLNSAGPAQAQVRSPFGPRIGGPVSRPVTSPYLNLLRGDGGIGFQYYRRVLPEQEFRRANRQQLQALNRLSQRIDQLQQPAPQRTGSGLGTTGHPTTFLNLGGYFGSGGSSGSSSYGRLRR